MELINSDNISNICDWIEIEILLWENNFLNKSTIKSTLSMAWAVSDDNFITDIFSFLSKRLEFYWSNPPYIVDSEMVTSLFSSYDERIDYIFCLLLNRITFSPWEYNVVWKLFERLTWEALSSYFGKWWKYKVFGFPHGRYWVKDLCDVIWEKFQEELPTHRKDRWLDVIIWNEIDKRKNKFCILNQSTSGINWTSDKPRQLNIEAWRHYIWFTLPPILSFSFPNILDTYSDSQEQELSYDWGLLIDRARIYTLIKEYQDVSLQVDLRTWVDSKLI